MFNVQQQEEADFHYTSDSEWDRQDAIERGSRRQDRQWVLSDRDVWHRNPYYNGPEQRHPEDYGYDDEKNDAPVSVSAIPAGWNDGPADPDIPF